MKTHTILFTVILFAGQTAASFADAPSVTFARSGLKAALTVDGRDIEGKSFVLLAPNGQQGSEPATARRGSAEFLAPNVRVPVVFRLASADDLARLVPGNLVVYPEHWFRWDKDERFVACKKMQFAAVGVPDWFNSWLDAVGFPVENFSTRESLEDRPWRRREKTSLLILGRMAAGRDAAEVERLAIEHQTNILVLEADWFGKTETPENKIEVQPIHARGALADLQNQVWPTPPGFRRQTTPWPALVNRLTWLDGEKYPLIEELISRQKDAETLRIALSYLPWEEQLGRNEIADELFLRILAEAAKGTKDRRPLEGKWRLLYPPVDKIDPRERPVMASASKSIVSEPRASYGSVIDLRGEVPPSDKLFADTGIMKETESILDSDHPLLILGDHPRLVSWKWLKLDGERRKSSRPGVIWHPDNAFPPLLESRLREMEIFTEWNIPLPEIRQGNHDENH